MFHPGLLLLQAHRPSWFHVTRRALDSLTGEAAPAGTCWVQRPLELVIRPADADGFTVAERKPGAQLPAYCPESHLNGDSSFCFGVGRLTVDDGVEAERWWAHLKAYVRLQSVAERTRIWPDIHALDHGEAARHQLEARAIAAELGLEDDYEAARLGEGSWLTDPAIKLFGRRGEPINGRSPCPRGCCNVRGGYVLRRNCPRRHRLLDLARTETARRQALDAFWSDVRAQGASCCGRMRNCPLRS